MSFEYESGSIYHFITIPASDLHSRGSNVPFGFVLAPECCTAAAAQPLLFLLVFLGQAPLAGRCGDKVVPPGVRQIRVRILEADERQGLSFRHGHERTTRVSGISRGTLEEGGLP